MNDEYRIMNIEEEGRLWRRRMFIKEISAFGGINITVERLNF